ncbi:MAG: hypothetical protein V4509_01750 [Patescibacteria group bacterium]
MKTHKRGIKIWHRRAGKDKDDWNAMIEAADIDVGQYYYIFPTYSQGKKAIWEGRDKEGIAFLDHLPNDRVLVKNNSELKIVMNNGSLIRIVGSDNIDALMGTSPRGVVFSEFSLQNPRAWDYIRPILIENGGWARFNFTPRGKNHAYDLYLQAKDNPEWVVSVQSILDTGFISEEDIDKERESGMSEDLIQQEFYCSFTRGQEGSWYGKYLASVDSDGRITNVPYDPYARVDTFWDLGVGDSTAIIFSQRIGNEIHIIDHYEMHGEGLDHYANIISKKPYNYGNHYAPHDIRVRELAAGARSRLEIARDLGINFDIVPDMSVYEGIELARSLISKCWFDEKKCKYLVKCLLNYVKKYNEQYNVYSDQPLHNWASHSADAFRMLGCIYSQRVGGVKSLAEIENEEKKYRRFS